MCSCYLYCITDNGDDTVLKCRGIMGSEIRPYDCGGYYVLYSYLADYSTGREPENLKAHNLVSLNAMDAGTVLPFRYGTTVENPAEAGELLNRMHIYPKELFCRLKGKLETGVKVLGKLEQSGAGTESLPAFGRLNAIKYKSQSVGYLMNMVKTAYSGREREESLAGLYSSVFSVFEQIVCDRRVVYGQKDGLLINGAFLILKENFREFKNRFFEIKKLFPNYLFIFSGPWPPYSFVNSRIEGDDGG